MTDEAPPADLIWILAPEGRDAPVLRALLAEAGIAAEPDPAGEQLMRAIEKGEGAGAILTDEALTRVGLAELRAALDRQPTWSDFPFVILVRRGEHARLQVRGIEEAMNATLVERPLHPASLISAVRSAIRGRRRQRLAARHLEELEAARAELKALAETLESKVRERTRDLAAVNDRLTSEIAERERAEGLLIQAQKMEAVGQLTGGVAHDFNNLRTAVIGSLDLLIRRSGEEESKRLARNALQAAERGANVTAQLLAFSRRQRLSPAPVDANETVSSMSDLLARSLGPRIRLETQLESGLWAALVDRTQLEMMILNLAINARDAMQSGGVLRIATRNMVAVPAELQSELAPGEYVCLSVRDNGVGMPPAVVARAFEPFFTTKEPGKGTGLGLSQLYGFAKQSGGTAQIESREGEGTIVSIYLPRTHHSPLRAASTAATETATAARRVLLVDDDDDVRIAAAAMIEELGYEVTACDSGAKALRILQAEAFDLLITDVMMPVMNGVELAARAKAIRPSVQLLFATGYADVEEFGSRIEPGQLVRKPFRMADLAARIAETLSAEAREDGEVIDFGHARRGRDQD